MKAKAKYIEYICVIFPLLVAVICVIQVALGNNQASLPIPMPQSLIGEYSYDRENWLPITGDAEMSALDGDLYLRGHFLRDIAEGQLIWYYRNHIGVTMSVNGETVLFDEQKEAAGLGNRLFSSMCGREWSSLYCGAISVRDEIEIRLSNPHAFGNESAYRDFLTTMCGDMPEVRMLEKTLEGYGEPFRIAGSLCAIFSLMILGAAAASVISGIPIGGKMLKRGLFTLFAGVFIMFDTIDCSFWNELLVLNTYGRQLSMMLAVFFLDHIVIDALTGKKKTAARWAVMGSSVLNTAMIVGSLFGWTTIYDTLPLWLASQLILCPLFMVFCGIEMRRTKANRLGLISGLILFAGILLDIFGVAGNMVWRSPISKALFIVLFVIHIVNTAQSIVINHRASLHAEKLEKELEDSRISIMLSQIQPHFLYNVLGTIRGLCREDPMQARQALGDFSDYLRGNMSALSNSRMIHFTNEFRHIEAYLRLEKMRMGEKLNILYDIQEKDFFIPPLTIQPLVENAIKHGLFEKGQGTLVLHTERDRDGVIVSVHDDGVGFDEKAPLKQDDSHTHVGLSNVRARLEKMSVGRLEIDSAPGCGTTVTVFISNVNKNGGEDDHEYSGR